MYSLRYSKTYNFGIVENNSLKHVYEDKFIANSNMFCVADGVTRDFPDNTPLKYPKTILSSALFFKYLPSIYPSDNIPLSSTKITATTTKTPKADDNLISYNTTTTLK